jgi:hypothetical protein
MRIQQQLTRAFGKFPGKLRFEELIYVESPSQVLAEVKKVIALFFPYFDFSHFQQVFGDIIKLFAGHYPGYRSCNTLYHDLKHTMDCLLVMARLINGTFVKGITFAEKDINLGLISALMHDTGYIQSVEDDQGTGAKYTIIHIRRSMEFMEKYLIDHGYSLEGFPACCNFLQCTGIDVRIEEIEFQSPEHEILGKILGTADLIGQMSDKKYLEKLPLLYHEFKEGGVPGFNSEFDLLKKTPHFWEMVKERFAVEFSRVDGYLRDYFRVRWGIDQDLYRSAIDRNIEWLRTFLEHCAADYSSRPECEDPVMIFG